MVRAPRARSRAAGGAVPSGARRRTSRHRAASAVLGPAVAVGVTVLAVLAAVGLPRAARGGEEVSQFDRQSLALRTSLHHDPSLEAPLERLVELYREEGRTEELVLLYRTHITQFPSDAGAHAVFVRLLRSLQRPEAAEMVQVGRERHPGEPLLAYLAFTEADRQRDPGALALLEEAVGLEPEAGRRNRWLGELVERAREAGEPERARRALAAELARGGGLRATVALARRALEAGFAALALGALEGVDATSLSAEESVEVELLTARAAAGAGDRPGAAGRLARLLGRVDESYWRRPEIVALRVDVLGSDAAREEALDEARARYREAGDRPSALDLAELLEAMGLRRDATAVLQEAAGRFPGDEALERRLLELFDLTGDERGAVEYLAGRTRAEPGRADLAYRYVKALFLTGDLEAGAAEFARLEAGLAPDDAARQVLDLARFLRRSGLLNEAARMFGRAIGAFPDRVDVRRELAEVFVAAGDPGAARALFAGVEGGEAGGENVLDAASFLIAQGFIGEAEELLAGALEASPDDFELQLLMVEALGKSGRRLAGERWLASASDLADTGARYARWLDAGVAFHELSDSVEAFFDTESARFGGDVAAWPDDVLARFLTFCAAAQRHDRHDQVAEVIKERLDDPAMPDASKPQLRLLLVEVLERDPAMSVEVQLQVRALAEEDVEHRADHELKLAQLYHAAGRADLARPLLEALRYGAARDAGALTAGVPLLLEYGLEDQAERALARATGLEPSDLVAWEKRISLLAARGAEDELRGSLRELLGGGAQVELSAETYAALRGHLTDSYWRSAAKLLASGDASASGRVLPLLDALDRLAGSAEVRRWGLWVRAHVLDRLGLDAGSAEALGRLRAELEETPDGAGAQDRTAEGDGLPGDGDGTGAGAILFPDGLVLSADAALGRLADRGATAPPVVVDGGGGADGVDGGPLLGLAVDWVFETRRSESVLQVLPFEGGVVVIDSGSTVAVVDDSTGKTRWELGGLIDLRPAAGAAPVPVTRQRSQRTTHLQQQRRPVHAGIVQEGIGVPGLAAVDGGGRLFVPAAGGIACHSLADGSLLWRAKVGDPLPAPLVNGRPVPGTPPVPPAVLEVVGSILLAYNPSSGTAAAFQAASGKLLWERDVTGDRATATVPTGFAGASYGAGMWFVYGNRPVVLDAATGRGVWGFDDGGVRTFPVTLAAEGDPAPGASSWLGWAADTQPQVTLSYLYDPAAQAATTRQFVAGGGRVVAPGVAWAGQLERGENARAEIVGRRLVLMAGMRLSILSLDFPVGGRSVPVDGVFAGAAGNKVVVFGAGQQPLQIVDLGRGQSRAIEVDEVFGAPDREGSGRRGVGVRALARQGAVTVPMLGQGRSDRAARCEAVVAGATVFVAGPAGVLRVNVHTGNKVGFTPWPAEVADRFAPDSVGDGGAAAASDPVVARGFWAGVAESPLSGRVPVFCVPYRGVAGAGRLFAAARDGVVVALSEPDRAD